MMELEVTAGGRVEVDAGPDPGNRIDLEVGDDRAPAWIERTTGRRGSEVLAWRLCPDLPAGRYRLRIHDRHGARILGTVEVS